MLLLRMSVFFRNSRGMSLEHWIFHWQVWTKSSCRNTGYRHPILIHGTPRQRHRSTLSADFPMELDCSEEQGSVQQGKVWNWTFSAVLEHLRKFEICLSVDDKETSEFTKEWQTEISSIYYWVLKMLAAEIVQANLITVQTCPLAHPHFIFSYSLNYSAPVWINMKNIWKQHFPIFLYFCRNFAYYSEMLLCPLRVSKCNVELHTLCIFIPSLWCIRDLHYWTSEQISLYIKFRMCLYAENIESIYHWQRYVNITIKVHNENKYILNKCCNVFYVFLNFHLRDA